MKVYEIWISNGDISLIEVGSNSTVPTGAKLLAKVEAKSILEAIKSMHDIVKSKSKYGNL
jgi:hypothetical protein